MPERVRITDVSPRDGLQNEAGVIATGDKAELVRLLSASGVDEIEVSSFVSPRWVPQLGDATEVFGMLGDVKRKARGELVFSALVPNERGLAAAIEVNERAGFGLIDKVSVFTAASETFSKKNTNATIDESIERFEPVIRLARDASLRVRGYVSCVFACPYEGAIDPECVARVSTRLIELGVDELDLGDTIGAATPESTRGLLDSLRSMTERAKVDSGGSFDVVLHLHDTFGRAGGCVKAALECGVRSFDGSAGGLGGCPYAAVDGKRAPGNIATGALVRTIEDAGFETDVDLERLAMAAAFARQIVAQGLVDPMVGGA